MFKPESKYQRHRTIKKAVAEHLSAVTITPSSAKDAQNSSIEEMDCATNIVNDGKLCNIGLPTPSHYRKYYQPQEDAVDFASCNKPCTSMSVHDEQDDDDDDILFLCPEESTIDCYFADDSSSDGESENTISELNSDLKSRLGSWAAKYQVSHVAVNGVLRILNDFHPELPLDARTLLATPRLCDNVKPLGAGQYAHFGLRAGIEKKLEKGLKAEGINYITVNTNVDGIPLFKSKGTQFWPILCVVNEAVDSTPFAVGVYCGETKPPTPDDLLHDFIQEARELHTYGILYKGKRIFLQHQGLFICDVPARVFLLCCKKHNSYHGCGKCVDEGEWRGRVVFLETNAKLRTDADYIAQSDEFHHIGVSPLTKLNIGFISQVPLDPMHLLYLGVMRRVLFWLISGPLKIRLSAAKVALLSSKIISLQPFVPYEFARKPRSLDELKRWKATEYRMFLKFTGPIVLDAFLSEELFNHFMLLHVATVLLTGPQDDNFYAYAGALLKNFVLECKSLYGEEMLVYNVHNLIHLSDEARMHGPLETFSCFPYENYLQHLKKLLRTTTNPLQQLSKRLGELAMMKAVSVESQPSKPFILKKIHRNGPTIPIMSGNKSEIIACQYKEVKLSNMMFSTKQGNNCFMLNNGDIVLLENVVEAISGKVYLVGRKLQTLENLYVYPCQSSKVGEYLVSNPAEDLMVCPLNNVIKKYILFPKNKKLSAFPLGILA